MVTRGTEVRGWTLLRGPSTTSGKEPDLFAWTAVIDVHHGMEGAQELSAAGAVGPVELQPSDVVLHQYKPSIPTPSFSSASLTWSFPIIVSGSSAAYSWDAASTLAAEDVSQLQLMLAVAWDRAWVLAESPRWDHMGPVHVPERLWWQRVDDEGVANRDDQLDGPLWSFLVGPGLAGM